MGNQRELLASLAVEALEERGFEAEFAAEAVKQANAISAAPPRVEAPYRDARSLLWCSIDNPDSRDLDQLNAAEALPEGRVKIYVAIADVISKVAPGSAIDSHASYNTTTIYTLPRIFPMLPERLSTDLTSLNPGVDRAAFIVEAVISPEGLVESSDVYRAIVKNRAKLAYPSLGEWLEQGGLMPERLAGVEGLAESLMLQNTAAQVVKHHRQEKGALDFETLEVKAKFADDALSDFVLEKPNLARELIENFMVVANGVVARFLAKKQFPVLRRVVRPPERWERIVDIAADFGVELPPDPDIKALQLFLKKRRKKDPLRFPDLSLSIIKLLGRGQYVESAPGDAMSGHFGLAIEEYCHSTAPNRRYPDIITQRLLAAALEGKPSPYSMTELHTLADHCTRKEHEAQRVERRIHKSAAALLLQSRIGDEFDGLITGASEKGTWVRILEPPVEGRVAECSHGLDVGDQVRVKLVDTDVKRGFIDFECQSHGPVGKRHLGRSSMG